MTPFAHRTATIARLLESGSYRKWARLTDGSGGDGARRYAILAALAAQWVAVGVLLRALSVFHAS